MIFDYLFDFTTNRRLLMTVISDLADLKTQVATISAPVVDFTPVLNAIAAIQVQTPAVDFTPVLAAIADVSAKIG